MIIPTKIIEKDNVDAFCGRAESSAPASDRER